MAYKISKLPFDFDFRKQSHFKKTADARSALAELKGVAESIPNENI